MVRCGRDVKVYVETPDGELLELSGTVVELNYNRSLSFVDDAFSPFSSVFSEPMEVEFTVRGTEYKQYSSGDWKNRVKTARTGNEWFCDYCHSVNGRADRKCTSCGASRSFLYD